MRSFGLCALFAVAACAPKSPAVPQLALADAEFAIRAARNAWSLAFVRRDTASLGTQWAPDGVLSTGAGTWRSRDEIVREHYAALFRSRPDITFTRELQRVEGQDGWQTPEGTVADFGYPQPDRAQSLPADGRHRREECERHNIRDETYSFT